MKRSIILAVMVVTMASMSAAAQATGNLTVNATVVGSINLVFNSDAAGVVLTSGAGTATAAVGLGSIQAFGGTVTAGTTRTLTATTFTYSTPVDVYVTKNNSTSANYTLKANISTADAVNTWAVAGTALTTTPAPITAVGLYTGTGIQAISLTVPFTSAVPTLSNTIVFTATAN